MIIETIPQLARLTPEEKLVLAEELWDEVLGEPRPDDFPLIPGQERELARRLQQARENPGSGIPYEEAFARVLADLNALPTEKKAHG